MSTIKECSGSRADAIRSALSGLEGQRLSRTFRVLDTRYFEFGGVVEKDGFLQGQLGLVLQCPWRLERSHRIVTGLDDARVVVEDSTEVTPAESDNVESRTLLARKLADLLRMDKDEGIIPPQVDFVVEGIETDEWGGFRLHFSDGVCLSTFPTGTDGEYWRFYRLQPRWDFVAEPGRVYYIGEQVP